MQTKSILMALLAMALVTACTNDETIEMNQGEGISLSAIAGTVSYTHLTLPTNREV